MYIHHKQCEIIYTKNPRKRLKGQLKQLVPIFSIIWQTLATLENCCHFVAFYGTISPCPQIILSSCHQVLWLFSSISLIVCKFVSWSISQLVNLLAYTLVSFSACACASWSLFVYNALQRFGNGIITRPQMVSKWKCYLKTKLR